MNAHVLNGVSDGVHRGGGTADRPISNVAALKLMALQTIRDAAAYAAGLSGWEGFPTDYANMVARAREVVDRIGDIYPGWPIGDLACIPLDDARMGAFWDDVSAVTRNVIDENSWLKDVAKYNPALIPVRAALVELVKANIGGLADMLLKADQNNIRTQWQYNGGNWTDLVKAMQQGRGRVNGIGDDDMYPLTGAEGYTPADVEWWLAAVRPPLQDVPAYVSRGVGDGGGGMGPGPNNPAFNAPTTSPTPPQGSTPPISNQGGGSTWGTIWNVAGPLVNSLLGGAAAAAGNAITNAISPPRPQATPPPTPRAPVVSNPRGRTMDPNAVAQMQARAAEARAKEARNKQLLMVAGVGAAALILLKKR